MYKISTSKQYDKDYVLAVKRGYDISLLNGIVFRIANNEVLESGYKNHKLSGTYAGCFECHIKPDWLLIYRKDEVCQLLRLVRTGTHSDLF
jgi:mRNA interferase YafQ